MRGFVVVVLAAAGTAACGGDGPPPRAMAAVDTVDGVEHWRYPAGPTAALGWSVDTVGVLGDAFAEDEYQFSQVSWERLAGDSEGNLYVLDRQGSRVMKYDPEGRHLATYGRAGEGPGELSQPIGLAVGAGDTAWVTDFSNSRLTGYPPEGGEPRTVAYAQNAGIPSPTVAAVRDGFIQDLRPLFRVGRGGGGPGAAEGPRRIPLVRMDRDLAPVDTLWLVSEPPTDVIQLEISGRVLMMRMPRQFAPAFRWQAFSDGGVVVSDTAAYLLRLLEPDGAQRRVIERDPAPRPVTEADRETIRQRMRAAEGVGGTRVSIGGGGPDEDTRQRMLEERLEKMTFADVVPRVVALRVDPRDRIWVGVAEEVADSVARIDVYERDGTLLGELRGVPMPDVFVGGDRMGVLRRDELEVEQVVLLRLDEGSPAGE